ncbi:MAG: hypothetical protein FWG59_04325 [Betaproteobacteria bacterium]|nr:hypothetical protein [Betaproteobacteria bacterium]
MRDLLYLYDGEGTLCCVQLSPELWERAKHHVLNVLEVQPAAQDSEPLDDWEEFKQYWDFKYPFCANVECLHCGTRCDDWEHDPEHLFTLRTASLGGLLVFRCTVCGASVRKKHFKDHMVFEMTPASEPKCHA